MNPIVTLARWIRTVVPEPIVDSAVRPAARRVLSVAFGRRGYKIDIGGQGTFRLSPDFVFRGWEEFGKRHNSGFARCIQACEGKRVFMDVGAHIGLYSLPVSRVLGPGGQVIAFEPSDGNYRYLLKHLAYNGIENIRAYQVVVGDTSQSAVRFYEHVDGSSGLGGLTKRAKRPADLESFIETERPQVTLDEFCTQNRLAPDVVKIDVEGAELLVLKGARRTLAKYQPLLFLSIHPAHLKTMGQSTEEVERLLRELGYEARDAADMPVDSLGSGEYMCVADSVARTLN